MQEENVRITFFSSTEEVLSELGRRMKAARINASVTQKQMAENTGLSLKTISNLENGKDVSFSTVIDVLRATGYLQSLDVVLPENTVRPSQIVQKGKQRERVRNRKNAVAEDTAVWKWGDEK